MKRIREAAWNSAEVIVMLLALLGIYGWACEQDLRSIPYVRVTK